VEGGGRAVEEGLLFQEIGRWIAADSKLGEDDKLRALGSGAGGKVADQAAVSGEVSDRRIDLGEGDLHGTSLRQL
jgi:hypothetical protein